MTTVNDIQESLTELENLHQNFKHAGASILNNLESLKEQLTLMLETARAIELTRN